jgi:hypothetical protein
MVSLETGTGERVFYLLRILFVDGCNAKQSSFVLRHISLVWLVALLFASFHVAYYVLDGVDPGGWLRTLIASAVKAFEFWFTML